ncbi:MAG: CHAD domain-containing protein [Fimbriimonadales bacterium]
MTKAAAQPSEVELKYAIDDLAKVQESVGGDQVAGLRAGEWRELQLEDIYFDTPDRRLQMGGWTARIREDGDKVMLTLKSRSPDEKSSGLHTRVELEGPATGVLEPGAWPASDARAKLDEICGGELLHERFRIKQVRRERDLSSRAGKAVLSVDEVAYHKGKRVLGNGHVLEVELRRGKPDLLEPVAAALMSAGGLRPELKSKESTAAALLEGAAKPPKKKPRLVAGKAPGISQHDSLAEAGRKVLRFHLTKMLAKEEGTRLGRDIEALHAMRVATRRMRAAWRVFDGAFRRGRERRYVAELRTVARALGAVRDLDVLLEGAALYVEGLPQDEKVAIAPLFDDWRAKREAARAGLVALLDSPGYQKFVDAYISFATTEEAGTRSVGAVEPQTVRDTAGSRIVAAYERVRAYDAVMPWADVETLHALRIEGKRLRYTLEFFKEALPPQASDLIGWVTQLQDELGIMHDADVAANLARAFLLERAPRLSPASTHAVAVFLRSRQGERDRRRGTARRVWRRIVGATFRRTLGRVVGGL